MVKLNLFKKKEKRPFLTEPEFNERKKSLTEIDLVQYARRYCRGDLSRFKLKPIYFDWTAHHDVRYYIDERRRLLIIDVYRVYD